MMAGLKTPTFNLRSLFPFLHWWPLVNRRTLRDDLVAGATGALVVLPQGVAFATIAGLPPEYGLYAAMVPTVIAALFGSSLHLVSGPTTAISVAIFAVPGVAAAQKVGIVALLDNTALLLDLGDILVDLGRGRRLAEHAASATTPTPQTT